MSRAPEIVPFQDRHDAGRRLAGFLASHRDEKPMVLALPRGGVPVGYEIALALDAPLDLLLVRKIGAPVDPELGIGAVVGGPSPVILLDRDRIRSLGIGDGYIARAVEAELAEIDRRRALYLRGRSPQRLDGRTLIVVDDGIATGVTMRAALQALREGNPARLVMAIPVAPADGLEMMRAECDEIVCLGVPEDFPAVGCFYRDFHQLDDAEVIDLLDRAARR
jgi:putative phosphoribosyl transferase